MKLFESLWVKICDVIRQWKYSKLLKLREITVKGFIKFPKPRLFSSFQRNLGILGRCSSKNKPSSALTSFSEVCLTRQPNLVYPMIVISVWSESVVPGRGSTTSRHFHIQYCLSSNNFWNRQKYFESCMLFSESHSVRHPLNHIRIVFWSFN